MGFVRIKQLPECKECGKEIETDFCLVLTDDDKFETCVCLECKDKVAKRLASMPYLQEVIEEMLEDMIELTPVREYDVIETTFADLYL